MTSSFIGRGFCSLNGNTCIFLNFSIRFRVNSISSTNSNIRQDLSFCFLCGTSQFFCVRVREVSVVVIIYCSFSFSMFATIRANRASQGSFNQYDRCQVIRVMFNFMFVDRLISFRRNFVGNIPYLLTISISLSVRDRRNVISTRRTSARHAATRRITCLFIQIRNDSSFPCVVSRRRKRLTYRNYALVLVSLMRLFNCRNDHFVCQFSRGFFDLSLSNVFVISILHRIFYFSANFSNRTERIRHNRQGISTSREQFLTNCVLGRAHTTSRNNRFMAMALQIINIPFFILIRQNVRRRGIERRYFYHDITDFRRRIRIKYFGFWFAFRNDVRVDRDLFVVNFYMQCSIFCLRCLGKRRQRFSPYTRSLCNYFRWFFSRRTSFNQDIYSVVSQARRCLVSTT